MDFYNINYFKEEQWNFGTVLKGNYGKERSM